VAGPQPPLPPLELTCLGPPSARLDGKEPPPDVLWRPRLALLCYLALSPDRARTRDHLLGLIWPEEPEKNARKSLNQSLYGLRSVLGHDRLITEGETVRLNDAGLSVDAVEFGKAVERDPARAVSLVRGDFLEGFILDGSPAFDEWVTLERQRWRSRSVSALVAYAESLLGAGRFSEASDLAHRALGLEPYSEPAIRLVMRATALSGDGAGALAAFHDFAAQLEKGIGEKPSRELNALAERIRRQVSRPVHATAAAEVPLVGRPEVHEAVFSELRLVLTAGPRTLAITAAPGMGRTRLLSECAKRAALEGATVVLARPLTSDQDSPLSTLRLLLRGGLAAAPGLVGADPDALSVLAGVAPEIAPRATPRPAQDGAHIAAALARVLAAVAEESPVALLLDDAHLADGTSLEVLQSAIAQLANAPVILVITLREESVTKSKALLSLRAEIGRALQGRTLHLERLSDADIRELVNALAPWCSNDADRDRLTRRLSLETGGIPFYAVTLLQGLNRLVTIRTDLVAWPPPKATFEASLPFSIPALVRVAIAARIGELDPESRRVLEAASIAGQALDLDLTSALMDLPKAQVEDKLALAERLHLVEFDGQRYRFTAPLIADVVRAECLTPGQCRRLRERAVELLASRDELPSKVLRVELLAAVRPDGSTVQEALTLAQKAIGARSSRTAQRALVAAELAAGPEIATYRARVEAVRQQISS